MKYQGIVGLHSKANIKMVLKQGSGILNAKEQSCKIEQYNYWTI
ncbi:unnamed protein product [Paramecium sonneborni]|uniref:Uncharacterized protein n=1 Tax=Paramecium sonneborni TaxID=65129 RepID=A0A8S1RPZ5_9CILI|nr:unnamed protein product [Paramecium sonneborni]